MHRIHQIAVVAAALLAGLASGARADEADDVRALTRIEYGIGKTEIDHDAAGLAALLAPDFASYGTRAAGMGRDDWIAGSTDKDVACTDMAYGPFTVRVTGDVATVWGSNTDDCRVQGRADPAAYVWLDVFERRGGRWLLVANHTQKMAPTSPRWAGDWVHVKAGTDPASLAR